MPDLSTTRSLPLLRWQARAPKVALYLACGTVLLVGLRHLLLPADRGRVPAVVALDGAPAAADGLAELFARAYLTPDEQPQRRAERLASFGLPDEALTPDRSGGSPGAVRWTTVVDSRQVGRSARMVTVAVGTDTGTTDLAVPLTSDGHGRWRVESVPAIVGERTPPRIAVSPAELEVEDAALKAAASRVVRHYLAGEGDDLSADLVSGADLQPPVTDLRVRSVDAVTWIARPRRVAVAVTARSSTGRQLALRYELAVVRTGDRWLVAALQDQNTTRR